MKTCVIGGSGFIGLHVTRALLEAGRDVVVLDYNPKPGLPPGVLCLSNDYGDKNFLRKLLVSVDEVIDLAYATVPKTSFDDPINDIQANLPRSVALIQEAVAANLSKLLIVSSGGTVYGKAISLPIYETHSTNPISPYGITKLTIEKYAGMFASIAGLPIIIVRPGNAYGEEQIAFTGQGFIATSIYSILTGKKIDLFGYPGTIRDYLHVSDIAQGIVSALLHGQPGEIYNIGSGIGYSNLDVINQISPFAQHAGYAVELNRMPYRNFDVPANILDSTTLKQVSAWNPRISWSQGIQSVWNNAIKNKRIADYK